MKPILNQNINNNTSSSAKLFVRYSILLVLLMIWLAGSFLPAQEIPKITRRVNDFANVLKPSELDYLESSLKNTEDNTTAQVVIMIVETLDGYSIEQYSIKAAQEAKLGQKEFNNGLLVLVALAEKKVRIEVGYGLESSMTDAKSGYIIRALIVPQFEKGKYFAGLHDGVQAINGVITKQSDITPEQIEKFKKSQKKTRGPHLSFGFIIFILIIIMGAFKNAGRGGSGMGGVASGVFWGSMMSGSSRGSGFSSGSSGGGFSGGGGSFGGGGASGGW